MTIVVRDAVSDDAERLGLVHAEAWRIGYTSIFDPVFLSSVSDRLRTRWCALLQEQRVRESAVLVAVAGNEIQGFARFGPTGGGSYELSAFYVNPPWWGKGIASALMASTYQELRDAKATEARLWTLAAAGRARHFYEKTGWTRTPEHRTRDFGDGVARPLVRYRMVPCDAGSTNTASMGSR
ncbi:MAG TPA: GNAT family N-acetyltransferase [Micromonospora sp.]|nr:GNAT family N-acetyltransferase [Micromonospora sp.]